MRKCRECGMSVEPGEYHPYAACLMFNACGDYGPSDKDLIFMACLIAVAGWAVIDGVLWVRHLSWALN